MPRQKVDKTTDGKKNIKLLPEVHESLLKRKVGTTWDNLMLNLMKRSDELERIEQSAMREIYKEREEIKYN